MTTSPLLLVEYAIEVLGYDRDEAERWALRQQDGPVTDRRPDPPVWDDEDDV